MVNPPHISTLPLTSHPWPPHLSPVDFRFAGPCPFNMSRRAEDDHVGFPCRLVHVIQVPHPASFSCHQGGTPSGRWTSTSANRGDLQASAGAVGGMTPRMNATAMPMATRA